MMFCTVGENGDTDVVHAGWDVKSMFRPQK